MKKCLFVMHALDMGGSGTSLLNLLSLYQDRGETCDLFLMAQEGALLDRARAVANLLPEDKLLSSVMVSKKGLKKRGFSAFFIRACFVVARRLFGTGRTVRWVYKKSAKRFEGKYDTVIAYQESLPTEYAQYIPAKRRVAWCHSNYDAFSSGKSDEMQKSLYEKYDHIVCVTNVIKQALIDRLGCSPDSVSVVYNTIPSKFINNRADAEKVDIVKKQFVFVSMGRFSNEKRFERAVLAAEALKSRGVDFAWYILGNGPLFEDINKMVEEKNLSAEVILTGLKINPFPYLKQSDCFVMTSENEGQPMVLNEALTLGVPTITTGFPSACEVVNDGVNGIIVPNTDEGVIEGVIRFTEDAVLREQIRRGANDFLYDNESILSQVSQIATLEN